MQRNLQILFLLHILNDGIRTSFVVLLPFIAKDLFLSLTSVGFLGASQGLLAMLLAFPAGFVAAKFGGLHVLSLLLLLYSLSAVGVAASPHFLILIPTFYLGAVGFGAFHTVALSLIAQSSNKTNIGRNMGNFTSVGEIGRTIIPPLAIFLTSVVGWRTTMATIAIIGFLVYLLMYFFLTPEKTERKPILENHKEWMKNVALLFKQKRVFLIMLAAMGDSFSGNAISVFLPFILLAKGVTEVMFGFLIAVFFVGSLAGKVILGRVVDRLSNVRVFIASEFLMGVMILLLIVVSHQYLLLLLSFLLGIFTKGTSPVIQTLVSDITHVDHYEKGFAISEFFIGIAAAASPIVSGVFADKLGITSVFYLATCVAILATIPVFAFSKDGKKI